MNPPEPFEMTAEQAAWSKDREEAVAAFMADRGNTRAKVNITHIDRAVADRLADRFRAAGWKVYKRDAHLWIERPYLSR
jgi:hypothetical protein